MILVLNISKDLLTVGFYQTNTEKQVGSVWIQKEMTAEDIAIKLAELSRFFGIESAVDGAVIASVSPPLTQGVAQAVKLLYDVNALIVGPGVKSGLNIKINDPSQLGADLVGMAAGVVDQYSLPCLLVNLSDTMTISYIDENKVYVGTVIYAGMSNILKALVENADLLNFVTLSAPQKVLGTDTTESIQSGVIYGAACVVDGFIDRIGEKYPYHSVVLTGKYGSLVQPYCKTPMTLDQTLLTDGLYRICLRQKKRI